MFGQGIFHRALSSAFVRRADASFDMTNPAMAEVGDRVVLYIFGLAFLRLLPRACHLFPEGLLGLHQSTQ